MRRLTVEDLPRMLALEEACFTPPVRASESMIRRRLALGHTMLGLEKDDALIGLISFSFARFSPEDYDRFPKTHTALTTQPIAPDANAVFVYNLAVAPNTRGVRHPRRLLREAARAGLDRGCTWMVGNSRIPSYAGALEYPQEQIPPSQTVRQAIDAYLAGGPFPSDEALCRDPLLSFYRRLTGGTFLWLQTAFAPEDTASGGMGVVLYGELTTALEHLGGP